MSPRYCDIHRWTPVPLACGLYECECGALGRRGARGRIAMVKASRPATEPTVAVRGERGFGPGGAGLDYGGSEFYRVPPRVPRS